MGLKGPRHLLWQRYSSLWNGTNPFYGGAAMYVGVDYHKKYSIAPKMDERGRIPWQVKMSNDPQTLSRFAEGLPSGSKIAIEATGNWHYFCELLEDKCPERHLSRNLCLVVVFLIKVL